MKSVQYMHVVEDILGEVCYEDDLRATLEELFILDPRLEYDQPEERTALLTELQRVVGYSLPECAELLAQDIPYLQRIIEMRLAGDSLNSTQEDIATNFFRLWERSYREYERNY